MQEQFAQAVLVVAHPDDEILWFSSLVARVRQVVICYLGQPSKPQWTSGRQRALATLPLVNVRSLGLDVAEVFGLGDWSTPGIDRFGMVLRHAGTRARRYRDNYQRLLDELRPLLAGVPVVITHNPWGEYGHEEHVQLFRAVRALQKTMGFSLWVSCYVSHRSLALMARTISSLGGSTLSLATDGEIAQRIRDLYIENGCWTWQEEYQWPETEAFFEISPDSAAGVGQWNRATLHFLNIGQPATPPILVRLTELIARKINRAGV